MRSSLRDHALSGQWVIAGNDRSLLMVNAMPESAGGSRRGRAHLADRLAAILQWYPPESKECVACAREVQRLLQLEGIAAEVVRVTHALLGQYFYTRDGVCFAETGFHVVVKVNDLLIDARTGPAGKPQQEYHTLWQDIEPNELIFTPMEMKDASGD